MLDLLVSNQVLGISFLLVAAILMLLMFRAWGYPYDKTSHKSTAPRRLVWTHRVLGWIYIAIYIVLMVQMVPRLWTYQVELPARDGRTFGSWHQYRRHFIYQATYCPILQTS